MDEAAARKRGEYAEHSMSHFASVTLSVSAPRTANLASAPASRSSADHVESCGVNFPARTWLA